MGVVIVEVRRLLSFLKVPIVEHVQTIFTDNVNGKIIGREAIGSKCFETEEAKTYQDWTLKNETEKVLEYDCLKAICDFRGKKWKVAYSEDVPVSAGPWKLRGLPGLIIIVLWIQ